MEHFPVVSRTNEQKKPASASSFLDLSHPSCRSYLFHVEHLPRLAAIATREQKEAGNRQLAP